MNDYIMTFYFFMILVCIQGNHLKSTKDVVMFAIWLALMISSLVKGLSMI